jgi:hypothetical protein
MLSGGAIGHDNLPVTSFESVAPPEARAAAIGFER